MEKLLESDWKMFRKRVPEWRNRYLRKKNSELVSILCDEGKTPTEQYWSARERMNEGARVLSDCFDGHSRSRMEFSLLLMHRHGVVTKDDMGAFSEEFRGKIQGMVGSLAR